MRVVFRADGSATIGHGHVVRCLSLAREFARRGALIDFISRELPDQLAGRIEREEYGFTQLPSATSAEAGGSTSGAPAQQDALATRAVLQRLRPDWLIVDHYGIDVEWERVQRDVARSIMVIDDLADRVHDCDALLDQNYNGPTTAQRYQGLVPAHCRLLLGPRYALLGPEYAMLRRCLPRSRGEVRRILVFCGGGDPTDETSRILQVLSGPEFAHLVVDVVLGADHSRPRSVEELAARRRGTTVYSKPASLAGLICRADLAIGAGGTTTWERLCLGLPSVVITIASNQEPATAALAQEQFIVWAGRAQSISSAEIANAVRAALARSWGGRSLVDGYGASRALAAILPSPATQLRLRPAQWADCELLFDWRNDPQTRAMSFNTEPLDWSTHVRWFESQVEDLRVSILIAWCEDVPVGQLRLDARSGDTVLSYSVDPLMRGRGYGTQIVERAARYAIRAGATAICAEVKPDNIGSQRIFERLAWERVESDERIIYRFEIEVAGE